MPRWLWLGSSSLALLCGCTSHAGEEQPTREREPEAVPQIEFETEPVLAQVTRGPITPLSHKPFAGALGDVTGDGQPDVVALCHATEAATLLVLRGRFDGSFTASEPLSVQASGIALGDLDGDHDLDAFLTDARGKPSYRVALNDGAGNFSVGEPQEIFGRYGGELRGTSLHDLDGNGTLDAVVPLWDSIRTLPGTGRGTFGSGRPLAVGRDPFDTAVGDLDGDGKLDLVATTGAARAHDRDSYDSSGASVWIFAELSDPLGDPVRIGVPGAREVELGDLDNDGRLEIVTSGSSGLMIIRDALGEARIETLEVATDGPLVLADLLAAASTPVPSRPEMLIGPSGPPDPPPPSLELITSSYMQSRIHVLSGADWEKTSYDAGSYVVGLYAADVDRDGIGTDVVVLNAGPPGREIASSIEVLFGTR